MRSPITSDTVTSDTVDSIRAATGLGERNTGIRCIDNTAARGRKKTEELHPQLEQRIRDLAETKAQMDPKAKVKIGESSRGGSSRSTQAVQASDHDMGYDALLVPFGILEQTRGDQAIDQPFLVFGQSKETSDFLADAIELWCKRTWHGISGIRFSFPQ